ncbi:hypothetical protein Hdeb2414_s0015g00445121 [Helianthus debilis subsp. tardiflorus]
MTTLDRSQHHHHCHQSFTAITNNHHTLNITTMSPRSPKHYVGVMLQTMCFRSTF